MHRVCCHNANRQPFFPIRPPGRIIFFMGHLTGDPVKNPGEMLAAQIPESHWTRGMQSTWASASVVEVQLRAPPEAPAVVRVDHFVGIEAVHGQVGEPAGGQVSGAVLADDK